MESPSAVRTQVRPRAFRILPRSVRLDEVIATVDPGPAPDPWAGRNVDRYLALESGG